jgi:hypothetical protein
MIVQRLGKCMSKQMIALLIEEVVESVGVGEGAVAEAVEGVDAVESVSEIN